MGTQLHNKTSKQFPEHNVVPQPGSPGKATPEHCTDAEVVGMPSSCFEIPTFGFINPLAILVRKCLCQSKLLLLLT